MAKKRKTKLGKALEKLGKGVKKIAKKAKNIPFAPLLPFKLAMKKILHERGVETSNDINEITQKFYNVVIQKKASYEIYSYEHLAPAVVSAIIAAVIEYFKTLKKKKERGEKLTEAEEKALQVAEEATAQAVSEVKEQAKVEIMSKSYLPIIIIALVAIILVFLLLKKKK
jgi:hypothetical protein